MLRFIKRNTDLAQYGSDALIVATSWINLQPLNRTVIRSDVMKPFAIPIRQVTVQEVACSPSRPLLECSEGEAKLLPLRVVHEANKPLGLRFPTTLVWERNYEAQHVLDR